MGSVWVHVCRLDAPEMDKGARARSSKVIHRIVYHIGLLEEL